MVVHQTIDEWNWNEEWSEWSEYVGATTDDWRTLVMNPDGVTTGGTGCVT